MIVVTTKDVPGYRITDVKGIVFGSVTRFEGVGGNTHSKAKDQTQVVGELRWQCVERLMAHAASMNANAVIRMRFETSMLGGPSSEIYAYGTAVVVEKSE